MKLSSNILTPEVLWSFGRIGESVVSPDKTTVLFGVTYYDIQQNKGNCDLYTVGIDGKNLKQITSTPGSEYNATWRPDGKKIGFLSAQSGEMQLYEINPDGTDVKQISYINGGIDGFKYSPDMSKILYIQEVKVDKNTQDIYPDLPKASGRIMDDLMYRHWDQFVDTYTHIFVADYNENKITDGTDIMPGEPWESPLKPFGGLEQVNFSPDSKTIAYTCRKLKGKEYALSTNSDIYLYAIATKKTTNLTEGMMGYDISPVYSPDGSKIA